MPEQKKPEPTPKPQGLTSASLKPQQQPEPAKAQTLADEAEDVIASLPKVPTADEVGGVPVAMQVVCPNFRDAPDHLKRRFQHFNAPMGQGPPTQSPVDPKYQEVCREFLVEAGWEEQYPDLWRDPLSGGGHRGEKQTIRMLLDKDKKTERPLDQLVVPVPFRLHTTSEAVGLQRVRMAAEEGQQNPTPLQRLDKAHEQLAAMRQANVDLSLELGAVQRRPVPGNNVDQLKAELMLARRIIAAAANRLKASVDQKTEAA